MNFKVNKVLLSSDFETLNSINKNKGFTDVVVQLENEKKYIASFFSYNYVNEIRREHMKNGEFLNGSYFWNKNMVLVKDCSISTIKPVVQHLIDEGEFLEAFEML